MNRRSFNFCFYAAAICFLTGIFSFVQGQHHLGLISLAGALVFAISLASDRRNRLISTPSPKSNAQKQIEKLVVKCPKCNRENIFNQPYAYHAGFSDQGFLYSDSGHFTLTWSLYDPVFEKFFPAGSGYEHFPSAAACIPGSNADFDKNLEMRRRFEDALNPAPDGGRWRFENPPRCIHCSSPISGSPLETVYYLLYPGSFETQ